MKAQAWIIAAVLAAPLIGLFGYIVYDQRQRSETQAALREYEQAKDGYLFYVNGHRHMREIGVTESVTSESVSRESQAKERLRKIAEKHGLPGPEAVSSR